MRYYYNLLCIHFNSFLKFIKLFWEFLVNMFDTLRIAWNDNVELILLTYWTLEYRIFVKPWTIFRFLRVWIGWCLGIIPFFYFCYLSFILVLFFLNFFFALVDGFFLFYLLKYSKNKEKWEKYYVYLKKISDWFFVDLYEKYPKYVQDKIDFYFSWDYFWEVFFKLLTRLDYYLYLKVVDIEWVIRWVLWEDIKHIVRTTYRRIDYYCYVIEFICIKLKKRKNWVILYYDLKKIYPIFKWIFFYMSFVGERHRLECFIIRKKGWIYYYFWTNHLAIFTFAVFLVLFYKIFILYLLFF